MFFSPFYICLFIFDRDMAQSKHRSNLGFNNYDDYKGQELQGNLKEVVFHTIYRFSYFLSATYDTNW